MTDKYIESAGATPEEWTHFSKELGLAEYLVPIAPPLKAPSLIGKSGNPYPISWKNLTPDVDVWSANPRLAFGIKTNYVRAIDVDVNDAELSSKIRTFIDKYVKDEFGLQPLPCRYRGDSAKFLLAFCLDGDLAKQVLKHENGEMIEFLATGQQFVATGLHKDGNARYEWDGCLPFEFPKLELAQFNALWKAIADEFKFSLITGRGRPKGSTNTKTKNSKNVSGNSDYIDINAANEDDIAAKLRASGAVLYELSDRLYIRCPNADAHTTSSTLSETVYFLAGTNGYHGGHFKCLHAHCSELDDNDFMLGLGLTGFSAIKAKSVTQRLDEYLNRYVMMTVGNTIYDTKTKTHIPLGAFNTVCANDTFRIVDEKGKLKEVLLSKLWTKSEKRVTAQGVGYLPGGDDIYVEEYATYVNSYCAPVFAEDKRTDKLKYFIEHFDYLIPDEKERAWFIQWLAYNVKHPEKRCKVAPLLIAQNAAGTGRGWITELMTLLLGYQNVSRADVSALESQFNDFMIDKVLCYVDETRLSNGKFNFMNRIKSMITEDTQNLNVKFGKKGTYRVYTNFMFMSNHLDAAAIDETDRRFNIIECTTEPNGREYFKTLYGMLEDKDFLNQVHTYLTSMDLSNFNWYRADNTGYKTRVIEASKNETELAFDAFIEAPATGAMTFQQLLAYLERDGTKVTRPQLLKLLQNSSKAQSHKLISLSKNMKARPWIFNKEIYGDNAAIKEELRKAGELCNSHPPLFTAV